jgi:hypothetical protein
MTHIMTHIMHPNDPMCVVICVGDREMDTEWVLYDAQRGIIG